MIQKTSTEMLAEPISRRLAREFPKWTGALGVTCIVLGVLAMLAASIVTFATVLTFGTFILAAGVLQCIYVFSLRGQPGFAPGLIAGLAISLLGLILVISPFGAATAITLLLAMFFMIAGVQRLVWATHWSGRVKLWFAFSGATALLLGIVVLIAWPESGMWLIGLFVAIELIFTGIALLTIDAARRQAVAD